MEELGLYSLILKLYVVFVDEKFKYWFFQYIF